MLPVTIFTVMMNNCQQDANRVTSYLFSIVVEFANSFKMEGGERKTVAPKNTKSSLLVPSLYIQA